MVINLTFINKTWENNHETKTNINNFLMHIGSCHSY